MTTTNATNLIQIGEWGYSESRQGHWYATPANEAAVREAYEDMDADDLGPDCDREIIAAGGVFVED